MLIVTTMTIEKLRPTYTFTQERLAALQAVVPEAFADGRINWEHLRAALGDYLEEEGADAEPFGLSWPGKRAARRLAATPSHGTLRPAPGQGIDEATTRNLFLEGDNLEVLKLLQKSYAGRVKLIYIDPPYNTGNDFIYKDDFSEPLASYLRRTGQTGEEGELLTTNPKAGGRFHSNWLNMMYPRLLLARSLLRTDGVIFISIDENESANLRLIMNDIFGEECFVAEVAMVNNLKGRNDKKHIATAHETLLIFAKEDFVSYGIPLSEKQMKEYGESDETGDAFQWRDLRKRGGADTRIARPNLYYPIYADSSSGEVALEPDSKKNTQIFPKKSDGTDGRWRWAAAKVASNLSMIRASKVEGKEKWNISYKVFLTQGGKMRVSKPKSLWLGSQYSTDSATKVLRAIISDYGDVKELTPKPLGLLQAILNMSTEEDDIILDFFSGSATTGHAIFEQNREDDGDRRFILVQLPEPTNNPQFPTIADIGKERIRRVIGRMKQEAAGKLLSERETPEDLGFKVFTLGRSHFKAWSAEAVQAQAEDLGALPTLFDAAESPLVDNWQPDDLLVEILLQEGFPLDSRITVLEFYQQNWVWQVESEACAHRLFVCLDERLHAATIAGAARISNGLFICLDTALSDEEKLRLADQCRLKVI
jgi:adenine-specific DNA-methyltransferase